MIKIFNWLKKAAPKLKTYDSIKNLPLYNWREIQNTGDYVYLLRNYEDVDLKLVDREELGRLWDVVYAEFIDTFGINDDFRHYLELKRDIEVLRLEQIETGDRSLNTLINIKSLQLKEITTVKEKARLNEGDVYVEKFMGREINEQTTTVYKFYSYIYTIQRQTSKQRTSVKNGERQE